MSTWIVLAVIGAGTYALRVSMFVLLAGRTLPAWLDRPMAVVAPAAVAAIVGAMTLTAHGAIDPIGPDQLAAVFAGFVVVRRTGNVMHAFAVGMPIMWMLQVVV